MAGLKGGLALVAIGIGALAAVSATSQPGSPRPAPLDRLEPGLWELRDLDKPAAAHPSICLGSPYRLIQLRHQQPGCSRTIVSRNAEAITVHYTCPGGGFGQTMLRMETPRLVQVDTQGIANGTPFAVRAEARRTGSCFPKGRAGR